MGLLGFRCGSGPGGWALLSNLRGGGAAFRLHRLVQGRQPQPSQPTPQFNPRQKKEGRRQVGRRYSSKAVLLLAVHLHLPLLQPPQTPHENPRRPEALPLPRLPVRLRPACQPAASHPHAHRRETIPLCAVQLRLQLPRQPAEAPADAPAGAAEEEGEAAREEEEEQMWSWGRWRFPLLLHFVIEEKNLLTSILSEICF